MASRAVSSDSLDLPIYSGASQLWVSLLGLRAAERYYRSLPTAEGLAACAGRILVDRRFDLAAVQAAAACIPQRGALLVTANHPTGVLDGVVLLAALLSRRNDVRVVANEVLSCIPVLADRVIPIHKHGTGSTRNHHVLMAIRRAWKADECVVVFPAGTVAHWRWQAMQIADAPWNESIQRFASKLAIPEYRAVLTVRNPYWFHACAAVSRIARTALLLRAFIASYESPPSDAVTFSLVVP